MNRRVGAAFEGYRELARRLERIAGDERLRSERRDLLRFQAAEIDGVDLAEDEEIELRRRRDVLRHAGALQEALGGGAALLSEEEGAAAEAVARCRRLLEGIASWEPAAAGWLAELAEAGIRIAEVARALRERVDRIEADPTTLDRVEERLARLERLCRKYGSDSRAVLAARRRIQGELDELQSDEAGRDELEERVTAALEAYRREAIVLSAARAAWGSLLSDRVRNELKGLALPNARFEVALERRGRDGSPLVLEGRPVDFSAAGVDHVTFRFSANPGEEPGDLARIASGGELSRVYLALQLAAREQDGGGPTRVFDEVDAGIGGAEAAALGEKLSRLAEEAQILVVTHLPQVASHGDRHLRVRKILQGERTTVAVDPLEGSARVDEVARMLAGKRVTDLSRSHARELIDSAGG